MLIGGGLYFRAADILSTANDDVFLAINYEKIAILIQITNIAGAEIAIVGKGCAGRLFIIPIAAEIGNCADAHLAAFALRHRISVVIQNSQINQRFGSRASAFGFGQIIFREVAAANTVGLRQAIAQQRKAPVHFLLDLFNMLHRSGCPTSSKACAAGQIIFVPVWMRGDLNAHQRNADKVAYLLPLDELHCLLGIPFRHHHQFTPNGKALQHQWHRSRHVEQWHIDQRRCLRGQCCSDRAQYFEKHHGLPGIAHGALYNRAVI